MSTDHKADTFRRWGYLQAELDPLGRLAPFAHAELDVLRDPESDRWRAIYCGSIGARFMHIPYPDRCRFIAERMEEARDLFRGFSNCARLLGGAH